MFKFGKSSKNKKFNFYVHVSHMLAKHLSMLDACTSRCLSDLKLQYLRVQYLPYRSIRFRHGPATMSGCP